MGRRRSPRRTSVPSTARRAPAPTAPRLRGGRSPARPPLALGLARLARAPPARPFSAPAGRSACPPPPAAAPRRRRRRAAHAARAAAAAAAAAARPRPARPPSAGRAGPGRDAAAAAAAAAAARCRRRGGCQLQSVRWRSVICAAATSSSRRQREVAALVHLAAQAEHRRAERGRRRRWRRASAVLRRLRVPPWSRSRWFTSWPSAVPRCSNLRHTFSSSRRAGRANDDLRRGPHGLPPPAARVQFNSIVAGLLFAGNASRLASSTPARARG